MSASKIEICIGTMKVQVHFLFLLHNLEWYMFPEIKCILVNLLWKQYHNQHAFSFKFTPGDPIIFKIN